MRSGRSSFGGLVLYERDRAPFEELADGLLDDVVHDVGGGVVDAAGLLDFGLFLDLGVVAGGQADDLAEELLVDLAEDVGGQDGELVGAVGIVQAREDVLEGLVVDGQLGRQLVGAFVPVLFPLEVEQAGVVAVVGLAKERQRRG